MEIVDCVGKMKCLLLEKPLKLCNNVTGKAHLTAFIQENLSKKAFLLLSSVSYPHFIRNDPVFFHKAAFPETLAFHRSAVFSIASAVSTTATIFFIQSMKRFAISGEASGKEGNCFAV
ncbi:MAG: hypothetical protein IJ240_09770 [Clostridia bacterium]|nr:hypothetical protein [Clostridia bacterium]